MVEWLTVVYLVYIFITMYFMFLFIIIYIPNRKEFFDYPKMTKEYSLSMVIPCYNAQDHIGNSIESLLGSTYGGLKKIIVVDDCSTDNSYEIIKKYAEKYLKVLAVQTPKNTGCAAGSKNFGAKYADTELVGFTDDDSFPAPDSIEKMIGFFDDKKVASVTSTILVKNRKKFIEKLQSIEYKIIAFTRKLLGFVDAIYVTPGPLTINRKSVFDKIGGFDESNITEDIEITWNFVDKGYLIKMAALSRVYTVAPDNFKDWFKQRIRWNLGGIQTILKYLKSFTKKGMLGWFILPFFVLSWILALFGIFVLIYRIFLRILGQALSAYYSVGTQTAIYTLRDVNLAPTVLFFFGTAIFVLSLTFTIIALTYTREKEYKGVGIISILVYMVFYVLMYPFILVASVYKFFKGGYSW